MCHRIHRAHLFNKCMKILPSLYCVCWRPGGKFIQLNKTHRPQGKKTQTRVQNLYAFVEHEEWHFYQIIEIWVRFCVNGKCTQENKNGGGIFPLRTTEMPWCRFDMKCGLHVVWKCIFSDNNFLLSQITSRIPLWPRHKLYTRALIPPPNVCSTETFDPEHAHMILNSDPFYEHMALIFMLKQFQLAHYSCFLMWYVMADNQ